MILYATHAGGRYLPMEESLRIRPEGKRNLYVNLTNRCNCSCTFCLRTMKKMAEESSLWLEREPSPEEVMEGMERIPWEYIGEVVFCGFGEPTQRQKDLVTLLRYVRERHPGIKTRLNTNGLGELEYGREISADYEGLLDTVSISLNASSKERYLELTRAKFGAASYEGMLAFAEHSKKYVPHVVMTVVDRVNDAEEIERCKRICEERGLVLRVREYEDS